MVGVHAALGLGFQHPIIGLKALAHPVHVQRPAAVGDIDAVGAVALHQERLLSQPVRLDHVAHHQKAGDIHPKVAGDADMLL